MLLSYIKENLPSLVNTFYWEMKQLQLQRYIACFTENYKASLMWGHYASSHKGFCAEYDFHSVMSKHSDLCQENKNWANFMLDHTVVPIKYSDKRVDATTYLTTIIQSQFIQQSDLPMKPLQDLLIATKCLLTKSTAWGYENEWRLFSPLEKLDGNEHKAMLHIKPTAIYIGVNTPIERAEEIYNICLEKDIPCFKMLQKYTTDDDNVANWFGTDMRLLFDLSDMAWLKNKDGLFEMHPLIRETILLDRESFPQDTEAAFHAYLRNNYDDYFYFALDYPLRARRIAIATCFLLRVSDTIDYAEACHNLAIELQEHRLYQAAEYLMQVSLRIKESKLGKNDPLTASAYHNLAMLYQGWNRPGDMDEAEKLHLKNLKIKKRKLYRNHPDLATSYNNLALLYQKREKKGDWDKAEELYKKALKIRESALKVDYLAVANSYNNLAHFYKCRNKKGDWEKAEKYYLKAVKLKESVLDGEHAEIPITYNNLATFYMERNQDGDWDRAEELYIKAITIGEKKLGNGHPDVAIAYCNLASLYRERNSPGDWDTAEVLVVGAVHILETVLGKDHPDTAAAYINLASLYMDNNLKMDLNKAERFLLMAKTVFERVYGEKHPNTIKVYQRLMYLYGDRKRTGDRERSLEYFYKSNTVKQLHELSLLK